VRNRSDARPRAPASTSATPCNSSPTVAESGTLDEESLRDLDAAMFRLRFALDRLEARG